MNKRWMRGLDSQQITMIRAFMNEAVHERILRWQKFAFPYEPTVTLTREQIQEAQSRAHKYRAREYMRIMLQCAKQGPRSAIKGNRIVPAEVKERNVLRAVQQRYHVVDLALRGRPHDKVPAPKHRLKETEPGTLTRTGT